MRTFAVVAAVLWSFALAGCAAPAAGTAAASEDAVDAASAEVASDTDASVCTCTTTDACCDGCAPRNDAKKCPPPGATWGVCKAGSCMAVPGSIAEWPQAGALGVTGLAVDGKHLAVALGDPDGVAGTLVLWDLAKHAQLWTRDGYAQSIALLPGEATVLIAGTTPALLLALADGATATVLAGTSGPVAASPDGQQVAAATDSEVRLYTPAGAQLGALPHPGPQKARHRSIAFSPDMQHLASATGQNGLGSPHGDVRLFDLAAPATPTTLACTSMSVDFAPDSHKLLAACWNLLLIYDALTGQPLAQGIDTDALLAVAWSPDGKWLVAGTLTGGAKLYAVAPIQGAIAHPVAVLPVPQVAALAFSADGRTVYVGNGLKPSVLAWTLPVP